MSALTPASYVLAVEGAAGGPATRPVFIPRTDPVAEDRWTSPILRIGGDAQVGPGAFLFTIDGRLIGLTVPQENGMAIVTAATLGQRDRRSDERPSMIRPPRDIRRRELGGPDPLDRTVGTPRISPLFWLVSLLRTRSALGLAPSPTPAIVFLPIGALLGPRALGLLSVQTLANLDLVVTVGLAVLGMLVGIALGREMRTAPRLFAAASLESLVTIGAVAAATVYFVQRTGLPVGAPLLAFALALGLCASASSATSADPDSEPAAAIGTRVADLDDVLPIALASCALLPCGLRRRDLGARARAARHRARAPARSAGSCSIARAPEASGQCSSSGRSGSPAARRPT